jgi:hypothetical protein
MGIQPESPVLFVCTSLGEEMSSDVAIPHNVSATNKVALDYINTQQTPGGYFCSA